MARGVGPRYEIELPALHAGQKDIESCKARFQVIAAGRRFGKTDLGVYKIVKRALLKPRSQYMWVAPIYPAAKIGWAELRYLAKQITGCNISESDLGVEFPNGSLATIRSSHDPDSLRGPGLDGVVMEEAAYQHERVWPEIIRPMLTDRKGWATFISTPAGRNWFSQLFDSCVLPDGTVRPNWQRFQKPTSANPRIDPEEIEDARGSMPALVFAQEHLAQFIDKLGALFKSDWYRYFQFEQDGSGDYYVSLITEDGRRVYRLRDLRCWAAVDVALSQKRSADYTAIAVVAETPHGDMLVLDMIRARLEHSEILQTLEQVQAVWQPEYIGVEKAAAGLGIVQEATKIRGLTIIGIDAKGDKTERATPLAMRMRAGKVYFLATASWLHDLQTEMLNFPEVDHDDQVDALAHADADRLNQYREAPTIRTV